MSGAPLPGLPLLTPLALTNMSVRASIVVAAALASCANAQIVAWAKGMF